MNEREKEEEEKAGMLIVKKEGELLKKKIKAKKTLIKIFFRNFKTFGMSPSIKNGSHYFALLKGQITALSSLHIIFRRFLILSSVFLCTHIQN